MSPSSVTRGVAWMLMPTVRNVYDDSGFTFAPPRGDRRKRRRQIWLVRADLEGQLRAFGAAQLRLREKLRVGVGCKKSTMACGTAR